MKEFRIVMVKIPPVSLEATIKYIAMTTPTSEKHKMSLEWVTKGLPAWW